MKKLYIVLFLLGFVLHSFGQTVLDTAVNFTVKDVDGNTLKLFDILDEGKIVVIDFFSTA